jgi:hypothetical protein
MQIGKMDDMPYVMYEVPCDILLVKNVDKKSKVCKDRWLASTKEIYLVQPPKNQGKQVSN